MQNNLDASYILSIIGSPHADVAKLDKAPDYESGDSRFESWHLHEKDRFIGGLFLFLRLYGFSTFKT